MQLLIDSLLKICQQAGQAILKVYHQPHYEQWQKKDLSPVTAADYASHKIIMAGLKELPDQYPILSEESTDIPFTVRQQWSRYWLVDPLDGTKEFIKHNDEFTINIALIENHQPVLGMLYVPVTGDCYVGGKNISPTSWSTTDNCWKQLFIKAQNNQTQGSQAQKNQTLSILMSRSHLSTKDQLLLDKLKQHFTVEVVHAGSALKFAWLAKGKANLYCRFTPTSEWDTAAGQAIVEAVGGTMMNATGHPFSYNRQDSLINGPFLISTCKGPTLTVLQKYFRQLLD